MRNFINKTFKGLDASYYFRHLMFGVAIGVLFGFLILNGKQLEAKEIKVIIFFTVNTLLYPYSRFVYEGIVDFIFGDNVFFVDGFWFLVVKFITMTMCWFFAIFIAPIGLAYLYFYHTKNNTI